MDLHSRDTFGLLKNGLLYDYPSMHADVKADVAIMGAGITGALVAWYLCKRGFDVVMVDKRHVGTGSTAASTSLLQYEIDTPLVNLRRYVGEQNAVSSYKLCVDAIYELQKICEVIDRHTAGGHTDFQLKQSIQFASAEKHVRQLQEEFSLRRKYDMRVQWLSGEVLKNKTTLDAPAAILSRDGGQVDAYCLAHGLLHALSGKSLRIYDNTRIDNITRSRKRVTITSREGVRLQAKHLVVACGYESQKYIPKKIEQISSTYAIVSECYPHQNALWYKNCLLWETAMPYLYLRVTRDNRILIGGKDEKFYNPTRRDKQLPLKAKALERSFHRLFPNIPFKRDFQWAGTFSSTKDGLPYIGSIRQRPLTSFALGFGGNGITFSVIAAQIISDALCGKPNRYASIFSFNR